MDEFQKEVLQRLTTIETKIDNYSIVSNVAYEANNRSKENEKDICEMKEANRETKKTAVGALISVGITILGGIIAAISGWFKGGN
jgi:membrane protein YqaA with SNARE-associated domain